MRKGASTAIVMILVMLITISLVLMSYQWLLKYSPQTQQELEKNLEVKKGCLKIENIDTGNKKITVRNCGDVDLSNFIIYLDSGPFAYYTGVLGAGGITQISYTGNINYGDHEIFVSSNYAETPKIVFYKPPCDIYVYQYMIPFVITESNKFYCLVENVHIDGKNAINFSSSIQNSTLNCQNYNIDGNDAGNTNGVYLSNNNKNTVRNCNVTDFYQGIYILNSNSNILINNTASSNEYGIELEFANYNTLLNNIDLDVTYLWGSGYNTLTNNKMTSYIRLFGTLCVNNNITGGSIASFSPYDYELDSAGAFNYFRNTNFTGSRKIHFIDILNSWFNYNNDTTGELWLKTNVSFIGACVVPCMIITRKLINWNNTLLQWNDSYDVGGMATYNVTGLKPNKWYLVYNNSKITYALKTDSSGSLPSFTIYLPANQEHEIRVEKSSSSNWFSGWNYRKNHTIMNSTGADVSYTINITVINATGTDSGSIVYINSTGNSKTRSDFGDIRFTNSTGSLLNYWMETLNSGANATFWVQIDGNLTSTNQTIYIYYGNNTATNISNITNTFLFGDDFLGTSSNVAPSGWNSTLVGTKKFNESLKNSWFTLLNLTSTSAAWSGVNLNKSIPTISNNFYAQALLSSNVTVGVAGQTELYLSLYSGSTEEYYSGFGDSWNSGTGDNASYITGTSGGGAKNIQDGAVNVSFGISLTGGTATTYYNKISTQTKSSVTQSFNIVMIRLHSAAIVTNQIEAIDYIWIRSYVSPEPGHNAWGSEESFL